MYKTVLTFCSIFFLVAGSITRATAHSQKSEEISGAIVAYHHWLSLLPCYHICGGSLIVRIGKPDEAQPRYIRIDFRYPDQQFPNELIGSKRLWQFKLTRTSNADEPIEKYVKSVDETGKEVDAKLSAWKLVPGAENEELPFGKVIASYTLSVDIQKLILRNKR